MRELVLKNLISLDKKRKEIFVFESLEQQGFTQSLEKRVIYSVKEILPVPKNFDLQVFLDQRRGEGKLQPKQTFLTRICNKDKTNEKFIFKLHCDSYAVVNDKIFFVKFIQYLKIEFVYTSVA